MRLPPQKSKAAEPVGQNTMPRAWSRANPVHTLAPPTYRWASGGHVSWPGSPGCGMVWKRQTSLPVRMSKARIGPGAAGAGPSPRRMPMMSRSSKTTPGVVACRERPEASRPSPSLRSMDPSRPKPGMRRPVTASTACRKWSLA